MTKTQKIAITALLVAAIGAALYENRQAENARAELQKLEAQQAPLAKEITDLQAGLAGMTNQLANLQVENLRLRKNPDKTELLKLRSEVTNLRPLQDDVVALQKMLKQSSAGLAQWKTNELADAGRASPIDVLQTYLHFSQVEPAKIRNDLVGDDADPPDQEELEKFIKSKIDQPDMNMTDITGFKILSQNWLASDKVQVELQILSAGGVGVSAPFTLRNIDGEWKLVVFNVRDKQGNVSQLDFFHATP